MHAIEDSMDGYRFSALTDALYDFAWRDYCDWYLEAIKPTVAGDPRQCQVLLSMTDALVRMLHPVMPFVTETLWPSLRSCGERGLPGVRLPDAEVLATAAWPDIACSVDDGDAIASFDRVQALVGEVRTLRGERNVNPKKRINLHLPPGAAALVAEAGGVVQTLCGAGEVFESTSSVPDDAAVIAFEGEEIFLAGLLDSAELDKEKARLAKLCEQKAKQVAGFEGRLGNKNYVEKAKPELVEETRRMLEQAKADLEAARAALGRMS
jgi:valyl-tRNA synthetase